MPIYTYTIIYVCIFTGFCWHSEYRANFLDFMAHQKTVKFVAQRAMEKNGPWFFVGYFQGMKSYPVLM